VCVSLPTRLKMMVFLLLSSVVVAALAAPPAGSPPSFLFILGITHPACAVADAAAAFDCRFW
jgi:hypothetical protein